MVKKTKNVSQKEKIKKYEATQKYIFAYFDKYNLHYIISDMMDKAFLSGTENPTLFMAEYLLKINDTDVAEATQEEIQRLQRELEAANELLEDCSRKRDEYKRRFEAMSRQLKKGKDLEKSIASHHNPPSIGYETPPPKRFHVNDGASTSRAPRPVQVMKTPSDQSMPPPTPPKPSFGILSPLQHHQFLQQAHQYNCLTNNIYQMTAPMVSVPFSAEQIMLKESPKEKSSVAVANPAGRVLQSENLVPTETGSTVKGLSTVSSNLNLSESSSSSSDDDSEDEKAADGKEKAETEPQETKKAAGAEEVVEEPKTDGKVDEGQEETEVEAEKPENAVEGGPTVDEVMRELEKDALIGQEVKKSLDLPQNESETFESDMNEPLMANLDAETKENTDIQAEIDNHQQKIDVQDSAFVSDMEIDTSISPEQPKSSELVPPTISDTDFTHEISLPAVKSNLLESLIEKTFAGESSADEFDETQSLMIDEALPDASQAAVAPPSVIPILSEQEIVDKSIEEQLAAMESDTGKILQEISDLGKLGKQGAGLTEIPGEIEDFIGGCFEPRADEGKINDKPDDPKGKPLEKHKSMDEIFHDEFVPDYEDEDL